MISFIKIILETQLIVIYYEIELFICFLQFKPTKINYWFL